MVSIGIAEAGTRGESVDSRSGAPSARSAERLGTLEASIAHQLDGLSVVCGILSTHGGEIEPVANAGSGSCFRVRCPRSAPGAAIGIGRAEIAVA